MGGGDASPVVESFLHHHDPYDADYSSSDNCSLDNSSRAALFTLTGGGTMSSNELSSRSNDVPVGVGVDLDLFGHCTANTSCLDRRNIVDGRGAEGAGLQVWAHYLGPVWSEVQSSSTSHGMPHGIDSTSPKGTPSSDRSSSTCPLIRHRRRFIAKGIRPRGLHQQSSSTSHRNFVHTDGHLSRPLTAQLQDASATTAYPR
ncbi:uncharacterized protein LOC100834594 [Brachypodium distachyon]|uniref:uncharacterized protein LOC100834594 n=1 Tax=Brachypodium distachyon TaxID=15368 RepID=UPI000D0C9E2B|nr:uncharacterized protein LOC100834594 [Brachypodium distachyon]|eukprot:XP_024315857.1 uncharacterized protein LOC100834594 [Brachypodium distachyon]